jgi:hypothetical protein
VSFVRDETSEAEAIAAPARPMARVWKGRMLKLFPFTGLDSQSVSWMLHVVQDYVGDGC